MKNLLSKSEAKKLRKIGADIAKHIQIIDGLHATARDLVGFEFLDVCFCEDSIPTTADENQLAELYVEWGQKSRANWREW
jgi:hypothetical protein